MIASKHPIVDSKKCEALCTCGHEHQTPAMEILSSEEAYAVLAQDCALACTEKPALLIDDENTHTAAGARIAELLEDNSVPFRLVKLPGDSVSTDELADRIFNYSSGSGLIIAVGGGTMTDLGKFVAEKREVPFWSVPTAPSMNGYTSSIVAIKINGVKKTLPSLPPRYIYVDPKVIRNSPLRLRQAGFCDVLAKSVSDRDWQAESLLFSGTYCALPSAIASEAESGYINDPEKILQGDRQAVMGLFEGLLFSGVAMSLAGSSAPASGGEHLISHFLDMREAITGIKPNLHGLQVGTGIVLSAACYRRLADLEAKDLKPAAAEAFEADAARIPYIWEDLAPEVEKQFLNKRDRLLKFDTRLPENWDELKNIFAKVRTPDFFLDLFHRVGLDMKLSSLDIPEEEFLLGAMSARMIRDRITVLDLSAHTGILEEAARETLEMLS
ncbi:MAG: iron-containing alcohol dehydrogenase [Proteobacteria bacterium]|nr:iron-containing alcohol dehydrogenase [Pseudomonadota bacterium]